MILQISILKLFFLYIVSIKFFILVEMNKKYIILELFSGTESLGKVAKRRGYKVITLDCIDKFKPDILIDILKWDYKNEPQLKGKTINFIWASPPCNTFSWLANIHHSRDPRTLKPLKQSAVLGNKMLFKTIDIIRYFHSKYPKLMFVIENPHAMMRLMPIMRGVPLTHTLYCFYGSKFRKRTDFFNNFPKGLDLIEGTKCPKSTVSVIDFPRSETYKIPPRLIKTILDQYEKQRKININTVIPFGRFIRKKR